MSRILVFNNSNRAEGEFMATLDRGWMLAGNPSVTGGGSTILTLTEDEASKAFLQFGRMVLVSHPKLPSWAGMIDPPWNASLPVQVAIYNAEYLLSLRSPEEPAFLTGSVGEIAARMIEMCNGQEDLFMRIGDTSRADPTPRQETLDGRTYWEQLSKLVERSGCEMQARAERDPDGRLVVYMDIATRLGSDTGFLYSDGLGGNASFSDAILDGPIINRVIGTGDESGQVSRLRTAPFLDETSIMLYRMRSKMEQFRDVREQATLDLYSRNYLAYRSTPRFSFIMTIRDEGDAFLNARLGNTAIVHFSKARLPGGVVGWRGPARMLALAYGEADGLLAAQMETLS